MIREILEIDETKCDGCGACVPSCAEGALYVEDGKLRVASESLCDGLGACLGACPRGALRIVRREAPPFEVSGVQVAHQVFPRAIPTVHTPANEPPAGGCPGARPRTLHAAEPPAPPRPRLSVVSDAAPPLVPQGGSRLRQWPVQLSLVSPAAPDLRDADLLVTADCVPFAYARFHEDLLDGRRLLVGCPKLDDLAAHTEKLTEIFRRAAPRSIRVVRMEVPCCAGLVAAARQAAALAGVTAPVEVVTIGIAGAVLEG